MMNLKNQSPGIFEQLSIDAINRNKDELHLVKLLNDKGKEIRWITDNGMICNFFKLDIEAMKKKYSDITFENLLDKYNE